MRILNIKIKAPLLAILTSVFSIVLLTVACEKSDDDVETIVPGVTGIRLIHSSEMSGASLLDLYLDDVKVTDQSVPFPAASGYFTTAGGAKKKVEVRRGSEVISRDTIDIREGHQYSVFVKELQSGVFDDGVPPQLIQEMDIRKLVITDDNNTSVPAAGKAKVRFVNAATTGNNIRVSGGSRGATFIRVNPPGPYPSLEYLTYNLTDTGSDFIEMRTGPVVFRASVLNYAAVPANVNTDMPATTLEAGKLYTVYLTGSPGGPSEGGGSQVPSTLELKIIATN